MNKLALAIILTTASVALYGANQLPQTIERPNALTLTMIEKVKKVFPTLTAEQVNNAQSIINKASGVITDQNQLAYVLSTAFGESGFRPIKEYRAKEGTALWTIQNKYWYTGYYGRGYVQLTWDYNYKKFGTLLGIDLLGKPDLALDPVHAASIIVKGMKSGGFTGVGLDKYFTATT